MNAKDDYLSMIELQLKKWDAKLERVSDRIVEMNSYVRARYEHELNAMRGARDAAYQRLQQMRTANESARRQLRTDMDASWVALKKALKDVSSQFD